MAYLMIDRVVPINLVEDRIIGISPMNILDLPLLTLSFNTVESILGD